MVKLGEVFTITSGGTPDRKNEKYYKDGTIPWVKTGDLKDIYVNENVECITQAGVDNSSTKLFPAGTVLLAMYGATIGACSILPFAATTNQACAAFLPNADILSEYLYYFLLSKKEQFVNDGVGGAQPNISASYLKQVYFSIKPLNEQKKICDILSKVSDLITLRKQQLAKLDELVKSRFIELFGEVETNIKRFTMKRMDECCRFVGGAQPDKSHFEYTKTDDNIRLIQIRDYKSNKFITYIPKSLVKKTCTASDIMIGRYGPPIFQILGGIEGAYNVALMKAVPTAEFNTEYFRYFLKSEKLLHYLESFSQRTAGQDGIQIDKLNAYPCFVPPMELQIQFATFIDHVDKLKVEIQTALTKLETLKKALLQQYFG